MRVADAVRRARTALAAAGTAAPDAEARTLVAHVADTTPSGLFTAPDLTDEDAGRLAALVASRAAGTPVQHLTGEAWFRRVRLAVGPGVFVPRPETEVMTGWCLDAVAGRERPRIVELCAGSGAISLAIADEFPGAEQWAVEVSASAVDYLRRNLALADVVVVEADIADALHDLDGTVDVVVANPPYIPLEAWESIPADVRDYDPPLALFSGDDGLDATRVVADVAARLLRPGGVVASEHAEVQARSASAVFSGHGAFGQVRDHADLAGRSRFVTAVRGGRIAR